jgi:alkyl hydroperoxide reductase subunit AhpC
MRVGRRVPDVQVDAYAGGERGRFNPADLGGKWLVLVFYPRDFAAVAATELSALAALRREFARESAVVVAAGTDGIDAHREWLERGPVSFPVVADTDGRLAEAFGVRRRSGAVAAAAFIVDDRGVVRHEVVSDPRVGRSAQELLRVLQALRTRAPSPEGWRPGMPTLEERSC